MKINLRNIQMIFLIEKNSILTDFEDLKLSLNRNTCNLLLVCSIFAQI